MAYLYPKSNKSGIYCDSWKKLQEMVRQSNGQSKPEAAFLCAYYVLIVNRQHFWDIKYHKYFSSYLVIETKKYAHTSKSYLFWVYIIHKWYPNTIISCKQGLRLNKCFSTVIVFEVLKF